MSLSVRDTLTPGLKKAAGAVADKRPILAAWGEQMVAFARGSFNNPAWRAIAWAPLKASTIAQKIKLGRNSGIMKRNLVLSKAWRVDAVTNSFVRVGTDRLQAPYLQFGTRRGLPPRPMLPFIGGPDTAQLAPWARDRLVKIGQAKLASLLKK